MTSISKRIAAGTAFLDERDPDWWKAGVPNAIDLEELQLEDENRCVLGQRCPLEARRGDPYWAYLGILSGIDGFFSREEWAADRGFTLPFGQGDEEEAWDELTLAWNVLISERRKLASEAAAS